jgi:peptidyl-tRNA hydrolase
MVFVVRRDLAWQKQKLAVMTAHAALALFKKVYKARNPALMQWVSGAVLQRWPSCLGSSNSSSSSDVLAC